VKVPQIQRLCASSRASSRAFILEYRMVKPQDMEGEEKLGYDDTAGAKMEIPVQPLGQTR